LCEGVNIVNILADIFGQCINQTELYEDFVKTYYMKIL